MNKSIDYFRLAIKIDPDCVLAYAGLTDCYCRLSTIRLLQPIVISRNMKNTLVRDEALAERHALLALIRSIYNHDWPIAEIEFKNAIDLAPDSALPYQRYGCALGMLGRFDEAITQINRALDFEPQSSGARVSLGIVLHLACRFEAAIAQARLALDIQPGFFPAHVLLGIARLRNNRLVEAVAELQKETSRSI